MCSMLTGCKVERVRCHLVKARQIAVRSIGNAMLIKYVLADALQKRSCQGNSPLRIGFPPFHSFEPETVNSLRVKFLKSKRDSVVSGCGLRPLNALEQWPNATPYDM